MIPFLVTLFLYCVVLVGAAPSSKRIVVDPPITSPNASTVWTVGDKALVTWDTSTVPKSGNLTGMIVLGFITPGSENLQLDHPLATDVPLSDGQTEITVPNVTPKSSYIVVLFGDSGNASPQFTITNGVAASTQTPSAPSTTDPANSNAGNGSPPRPSTPLSVSEVTSLNPGGPVSSVAVSNNPTTPVAPAPASSATSPAVVTSSVLSTSSRPSTTAAASNANAASRIRMTQASALLSLFITVALCF